MGNEVLETYLKKVNEQYRIDLHGNAKHRETAPDGSKDENVFDIMQGVSINIFVRRSAECGVRRAEYARVHHLDLYGLRQAKFDWLDTHDLANAGFTDVTPTAPYYFFKPTNDTGVEEYARGFSIAELFAENSVGVVTANDKVLVANSRNELCQQIEEAFAESLDERRVCDVIYRPFDTRLLYYDVTKIERPREKMMRQLLEYENVALLSVRQLSGDEWSHVGIADKIVDDCRVSNRSKERGYVFPLWLYAKDELSGEVTRKANFDDAIYAKICAAAAAKTPSLRTAAEIQAFLDGEPVARLTGHEFEGVKGIKALKQAIYDSYESVQWRTWRSDVGTVQLSRSGINDSLCHGFGRMKIAAFAALPQLIAGGMAVRRSENWKGRGYDSVVLVAPVEIGAVAHCAFIIVNSMKDGGYRFYLHEVGRLEDMKKPGGMRTGFADCSVLSRTPGSLKSLAFSLWAVNGDSTGAAADATERVPPERVFDYIYAVLHDVGYREKYREFLKVDFPRIPYPADRAAFERLADLGAELRELHLLKRHAPKFGTLAAFPVAGTNAVEGAKRADGRVWINVAQYFDGVDAAIWDMKIGGYRPAQKWLKDRKGRTLANEEIGHYRDIVFVLGETRRIMGEIREIGVAHG